ncbi:MAG TPA: hypothetical protein VM308_07725 [Sphingomicrobium sp.]|nr:hypothetical protein [Sphingomicrobium sp.]
MFHLLPQAEPQPQAYAEAVSRLASVRHALRLVDGGFADGPAPDADVAAAWDDAGEARRRLFDRRSARLVGAAAAGIEAMLAERQDGREPHAEASKALADEVRRELRDVANVILG